MKKGIEINDFIICIIPASIAFGHPNADLSGIFLKPLRDHPNNLLLSPKGDSKDMLNRTMSQARKDFYQANVNEVKNKFFNAITSAIKDGAVSVVVDVFDYYSGFAALRG